MNVEKLWVKKVLSLKLSLRASAPSSMKVVFFNHSFLGFLHMPHLMATLSMTGGLGPLLPREDLPLRPCSGIPLALLR